MIERLTVGPIGENAYVLPLAAIEPPTGVYMPNCILVDPGDEGERILAFLDSRGLIPSCVVATHGHLDHTAALPTLFSAWISRGLRVPLAVHGADLAYFGKAGEATNRALFAAIRATGFFRSYWTPLPEPDLLLSDGDFLPHSTWKVIHSPGHTAGSICLFEASLGILISGDTLFKDGVGRTDGPDSDQAALNHSITSVLFSLPLETKVFPGHGDPTSIGREVGEILG